MQGKLSGRSGRATRRELRPCTGTLTKLSRVDMAMRDLKAGACFGLPGKPVEAQAIDGYDNPRTAPYAASTACSTMRAFHASVSV